MPCYEFTLHKSSIRIHKLSSLHVNVHGHNLKRIHLIEDCAKLWRVIAVLGRDPANWKERGIGGFLRLRQSGTGALTASPAALTLCH